LCGLVWQESSKTIHIVPTVEPAAAINLKYLSLSLSVRMKEGREPVFSLDPQPESLSRPQDRGHLWQVKRFEPRWLAGTCVGEVLFQADYHLKELSMGEYPQPIAGMTSCFDHIDKDEPGRDWNAREWFVVKSAGISLSHDNVLIPHAEIGVQARETRVGPDGQEDIPLTRQDHPLVRYADSFSHYFELIAERKSVFYHLRDLAKAAVLAKFLVENGAHLEDFWFSLAGAACKDCCPEIPQLWNEHRIDQVEVVDGRILCDGEGSGVRTHGVYGGVEMGIDDLGQVATKGVPRVSAVRIPSLTARVIPVKGNVPEFPIQVPGAKPRGVDLNLDELGSMNPGADAHKVAQASEGSWAGHEFIGSSFWSKLQCENTLPEADRGLLKDVFHPTLSDRRSDGDVFVPPDTSYEHVARLRKLVEQEFAVKQQRKDQFLAASFSLDNLGLIFPSVWTPNAGRAPDVGLEGPCPFPHKLSKDEDVQLFEQAAALKKVLAPSFDQSTEDGTRFRVYQAGSLEVRTLQEQGQQEVIAAVFSHQASKEVEGWTTVAKNDRVLKATEYVENSCHGVRSVHFFAVLETNQGDLIVAEMLEDGVQSWSENPTDLQNRRTLARVFRVVACHGTCITIETAKMFGRQSVEEAATRAVEPGGVSKHFVDGLFSRLMPAKDRPWQQLTAEEKRAADLVGIRTSKEWDERSSQVWAVAWHDLGELRRECAGALGFGRATWPLSMQAPWPTWAKAWTELTAAQKLAAKLFGVHTQHAWEGVVMRSRREEMGSIWEKSWAQLTAAERKAVHELGCSGAKAWDEASWLQGGAWESRWAELTEEEQRFAGMLDVHSPDVWDTAFGDAGKRGQQLRGAWELSWSKLSSEQRHAAKQLGILGAGAWDKSKAAASAEREWAQLSQAEQQARMERWFRQRFQGTIGGTV